MLPESVIEGLEGGGLTFFVHVLLSGPSGNFTKARHMSCS